LKVTTVLIVEDDLSILRLFKIMLESEGFHTFEVNNGEKVVNMYKSLQEKPDIILMDHRMPIKNGIEVLKEILAIDNHSKIILLSADTSIKNNVLSIGVIKFIKKPFSNNSLIKNIKTVLSLSECANIV